MSFNYTNFSNELWALNFKYHFGEAFWLFAGLELLDARDIQLTSLATRRLLLHRPDIYCVQQLLDQKQSCKQFNISILYVYAGNMYKSVVQGVEVFIGIQGDFLSKGNPQLMPSCLATL